MSFRTWLADLHFARNFDRLQQVRRAPRRTRGSGPRLGVEALEDRVVPSTFTVLNTLDSGPGSFRDAIAHVNADPGTGTDKIAFALSGTGPFVIQPLTALPVIAHPTVIDGYTQAGAHANTLTVGDNAVIMIQLDGTLAGQADGLALSAGGSTVKGLSFTNFIPQYAPIGGHIDLTGGGNDAIQGNFVGLTPGGLSATGYGAGAVAVSGAGGNRIGGASPAARNVIDSDSDDVAITGPNNFVQGNYLNSDPSGTKQAVASGGDGIGLSDATNTTIGGTRTGAGNVILALVDISDPSGGPGTTGTVIQGNNIGVDSTGSVGFAAIGFAYGGVYIDEAYVDGGALDSKTLIGGTAAGARNLISGIAVYNVSDVSIQGNYIGTDSTGLKSLGLEGGLNYGNGILLSGATHVTIGGSVKGAGNLISGNSGLGIDDEGLTTGSPSYAGNVIQGNLIGTDATGAVALPNGAGGISIESGGTSIGGTTDRARNVISGNNGIGAFVAGGYYNDVVQGNYIGTDATGTIALPNTSGGLDVAGVGDVIGGTTGRARNVISGNGQAGLVEDGTNDLVEGNFIGTDATGTIELPNATEGVFVGGVGDVIGGTTARARNVISGNGQAGVVVAGASDNALGNYGSDNIVQGNDIGTDVSGTHPLGNASDGVLIRGNAVNNTIGGLAAGAGNLIAHNGGSGIGVVAASGYPDYIPYNPYNDSLLSNSIFGNARLGIDLGDDGVTPNSPGANPSAGPNSLQNYPVLTAALDHGGLTNVLGTLNGAPGTTYTVQFFTDPSIDPSGHGQGRTYLGSTTVLTDPTGNVVFTAQFQSRCGTVITATATDPLGNTSEFSADVVALDKIVTAGNDAYRIDLNTTLTVATPGVQVNDLASGGKPIVSSVVVEPAHGTLALAADGSFTYTPTAGYTGTDTFRYKDTADGHSATARVTITVAPKAFVVTNTNDSGPGSLRQAILDANLATSAPPDTIRFAIAGTGPFVIQPLTALPAIAHPTIVDGYSQPGAAPNTLARGDNAVIPIQLDGSIVSNLSNAASYDGLQLTAGGSTVQGLDVTDFGNGVGIHEFGDSGDLIRGNFLGTDATGDNPLGNYYGIELDGSANTIGGTTAASRNLISGNVGDGVYIGGGGNRVAGNYIGTDATGTLLNLGNGSDGVELSNSGTADGGNIIGGTTAGAGNLISDNGYAGVEDDGSGNDLIAGNDIGTDVTGTLALGNAGSGVILADTNGGDTVGGTTAGARNLISGNSYAGVEDYGAGNNLIAGNYIGTDVSGTRFLGNTGGGVQIYANGDTLGGTATGAGNLISGNVGDGVLIVGGANLIQGNEIGTDITGTNALGNTGNGITIPGSSNTVGGTAPGAGNTIAFNTGDGATVGPGTGNAVRQNSIFSNGALGIDLIDGGNNAQAAPVVTSAVNSGGNIGIDGTLTGVPHATYTVELFSNPSGTSEGQTFFGSVTVTTDGTGSATFAATFAPTVPQGDVITATATDPFGDTSIFSNGLGVI